jgi:hypothetical protein
VAERLRVGIISANWGVTAHLPAWRANPDVEVVAICTAHRETAEAAAKAHKIPKAFWDYRKMAEDAEVDVVDVGTRPSLRYDMCIASLRAGKHVYTGVNSMLQMSLFNTPTSTFPYNWGCHVHSVIEAAHKSAQERRWVRPRALQ